MNAIKVTPKESRVENPQHVEIKLRVLSANQRRQVSTITLDWKRFTYNVGNGIYNKI